MFAATLGTNSIVTVKVNWSLDYIQASRADKLLDDCGGHLEKMWMGGGGNEPKEWMYLITILGVSPLGLPLPLAPLAHLPP